MMNRLFKIFQSPGGVCKRFTHILVLCLAVSFSFLSHAQITEVIATIDKNPVMLDESFTLTVVANDDVEREAFDSSSLLSDFVVGRTSVSSQTRMVNFNTSRTTTWSTTLFPRETGTFTIPPISINGQLSEPIRVSVIPVSNGANGETRDIFVTTSLEKESVYLHQQVKYSVKLYLAREIERGSLQAPALENAEIRQIGKDAEYSEILNGKRYRVIERDFIITPQRSGEFSIKGPIFQGEVVANSRQSFGFFNRTESVSRVGPAQQLSVAPIPETVTEAFLPSEFVDLHQEWSIEPDEWRVGEPVTRTITLTAVGLTESLLPEIDDTYPPALKTYPDQANTATAENNDSLVAQRTESIALIPSRAGTFVIPPVSLEWFNVTTETIETVTLPAKSIRVLPAANTAVRETNPVTPSQNQNKPALDAEEAETYSGQNNPPNANVQALQAQIEQLSDTVVRWQWICFSLVLMCVVLMIISVLIRSKSSQDQTPKHATNEKSKAETQLWHDLKTAVNQRHLHQIRPLLLNWLNAVMSTQSQDLNQRLVSLDQSDIIEDLDAMYASQYSNNTHAWQSATLLRRITELRKKLQEQSNDELVLGPLYPP